MIIHFNGAAQTVTGSQYLVQINGAKLLLECGLYQGRRANAFTRNANFKFDPRYLDAVILSHAHIDHSGNLPNLVKNNYEGSIYATPATRDLTDIMVRDSAHIQEADADYINKKKRRKGEPQVIPLYTRADAEKVVGQMVGKDYSVQFEPIPGVIAHFVDAGHILGSAAVVLDIAEKNQPKKRLWFSGDIGRPGLPLIKDPVLPDQIDLLMMECTYGDKPHREPELARKEFKEVILRTFQRKGKVIIPAFAVGRTQELVFTLNELMTHGEIPKIPVYVDSPLAVNTTGVFEKHPECYDAETKQFVLEHRHPALAFDQLHYVHSVDESKSLNEKHNSMVIISASGMAETGRILHHLKNNIEDSRNTVMIVSWQAPETLGRRIAERQPNVKIFGEEYQLRAEVATIGGFSAHAGQDMLVRYAEQEKTRIKKLILVHGEQDAANALIDQFEKKRIPRPIFPALYDSIEL
jgi:metallo-beta-lactamase family protein